MKKIVAFLIFSILPALFAVKASAADFSYYAINAEPAAFKEGAEIKGYYAEILQRVAKELGQSDVKVNLAAYPRILHALNENTSGFVITCLFASSKFNEKVKQPHKVGHFRTGVISMGTDPFTWETAKGKKVATVKGASKVYGEKFYNHTENGDISLVAVTDYKQAVQMLTAGRINGFAGNLGPLIYKAKKESLALAEPAVITEKISNITISTAPGTPDGDATVAKIGAIVEKLMASGEIQGMIENYLPHSPQPR